MSRGFSDVELWVQYNIPRRAWAEIMQVSPERVDRLREVARGSTRVGSHVGVVALDTFRRLIHRVMEGTLKWSKDEGWKTVDHPRCSCPQNALRCDGVAGVGVCPKYWTECKHYVNLETLRACRNGSPLHRKR